MRTLISTLVCCAITLVLAIQHPELRHWFVIPLTACGVVVGRDIVGWTLGDVDTFDPGAIAAFAFFNGFYIAPMLQIVWDFFPYMPRYADRENWTGVWAIFSLVGLLVYVVTRDVFKFARIEIREVVRVNPAKFKVAALALCAISFGALAVVFVSLGGLSGAASAYALRAQLGIAKYNPYEGLGAFFQFATSAAYVVPVLVAIYVRDREFAKTWQFFVAYAAFSVVLAFVVSGVFGSRARIVYPAFISIAAFHFIVRPVGRRWVVLGVFAAAAIMNSYYWYKMAGVDGISAILNAEKRQQILAVRKVDSQSKFVVTRDFSRSDFQSFLLYREFSGELRHAWGRTYVGAIFSVVPRAVLPARPATAAKEKTEVLFGEGTYVSGRLSTLLAGLFGEAVINFGVWLAALSYCAVGLIASFSRRLAASLHESDIRRVFIAPLCLTPMVVTFADSNVVVMFAFAYLLVPFMLVKMAGVSSKGRSASAVVGFMPGGIRPLPSPALGQD